MSCRLFFCLYWYLLRLTAVSLRIQWHTPPLTWLQCESTENWTNLKSNWTVERFDPHFVSFVLLIDVIRAMWSEVKLGTGGAVKLRVCWNFLCSCLSSITPRAAAAGSLSPLPSPSTAAGCCDALEKKSKVSSSSRNYGTSVFVVLLHIIWDPFWSWTAQKEETCCAAPCHPG